MAGVTQGPSHVEPPAECSSSSETANTTGEGQRKARGNKSGCASGWWQRTEVLKRLCYLSTFMCSDFKPRTPADRSDSNRRRVRPLQRTPHAQDLQISQEALQNLGVFFLKRSCYLPLDSDFERQVCVRYVLSGLAIALFLALFFSQLQSRILKAYYTLRSKEASIGTPCRSNPGVCPSPATPYTLLSNQLPINPLYYSYIDSRWRLYYEKWKW